MQMLKTLNLTRIYPGGGGVKAVNLEIQKGDFLVLSGPNGSGKTTLIRLLSLCDEIDKGHILMDDMNTERLKPRDYYLWRRKLGTIHQDLMLLPERTVFQNVALVLRVVGMSRRKSKRKALSVIAQVGLMHKLRDKVRTLSGGEARRTAIARALCNEPFLLLADEPIGDLDIQTAREIMNLFEEINAFGMTVLLVTHRNDVRPACKFKEIKMDRGVLIQ